MRILIALLLVAPLRAEVLPSAAYFTYLTATITQTKETAPDDVPISDDCPNCNGTGKLGDGTIFIDCPVCDGTGKRKTQTKQTQPTGGLAPVLPAT